ncbi:invasion associated locus B family protein [Segnochrobactraceae bacterium EtOH-i3]
MRARFLAVGLLMILTAGSAAAQQAQGPKPTLIKQSNDWEAYTVDVSKGTKICYALSRPKTMQPGPDSRHGDVFFFISHRPKESVRNEASVIVGYALKEGSEVTVDIDGNKFSMFTKGDGAWVKTPEDEARLVAALKAGKAMKVVAVSSRGTNSTYTFSLSGVSAGIQAIDQACK